MSGCLPGCAEHRTVAGAGRCSDRSPSSTWRTTAAAGSSNRAGRQAPLDEYPGFYWAPLTEGFAPALLGFRPQAVAIGGSATLTAVICTMLIAGFVGWTAWKGRGRALRAWAWFLLCFAVSHAAFARGRLGLVGPSAALETRYQIDNLLLFLIAAATALAATAYGERGTTAARQAFWPSVAPGLLVVLVASWASNSAGVSFHGGDETRAFFDGYQSVRRDLDAERGGGPLDGVVPPPIQLPNLFPYNAYSQVLAVVDPEVPLVESTDRPLLLNAEGKPYPVVLMPTGAMHERLCLSPTTPEAPVLLGATQPTEDEPAAAVHGALVRFEPAESFGGVGVAHGFVALRRRRRSRPTSVRPASRGARVGPEGQRP